MSQTCSWFSLKFSEKIAYDTLVSSRSTLIFPFAPSFIRFFLSVSQAFSRGGLSTRWNLPASNTWKSPFRERDDSLLCVSNGRFRRASVTPSWSQSRLDCEDYLLRLFRGFGEKIVPSSFCFSFSFSLLSARFLFRLTFGGKVWNGSFSFWYILFFFSFLSSLEEYRATYNWVNVEYWKKYFIKWDNEKIRLKRWFKWLISYT